MPLSLSAPPAPAAAASEDIIRVHRATMRYEAVVALNAVSLAVRRGEIVGLLGPNGAGKTTLLEIIEGVRCPTGGRVEVCGEDPRSAGPQVRGGLGVVFQRCSMPKHVTVARVVQLCRVMYPEFAHRALLLTRLGLTHLQDRLVGELSVGQQQRLCVFVALYGDRPLVVLDEPTSALDVRSRRSVWDTILELKKRGLSGLIATHDMAEAAELCDRIVFIESGAVQAHGDTRSVIESAAARLFTFRFCAPDEAVQALRERLQLGDGIRRHGTQYELQCPQTRAAEVFGELLQLETAYGFNAKLSLSPPTLERAYLDIIQQAD